MEQLEKREIIAIRRCRMVLDAVLETHARSDPPVHQAGEAMLAGRYRQG